MTKEQLLNRINNLYNKYEKSIVDQAFITVFGERVNYALRDDLPNPRRTIEFDIEMLNVQDNKVEGFRMVDRNLKKCERLLKEQTTSEDSLYICPKCGSNLNCTITYTSEKIYSVDPLTGLLSKRALMSLSPTKEKAELSCAGCKNLEITDSTLEGLEGNDVEEAPQHLIDLVEQV